MDIVIVRGGGDIGTGIAHRLFKAGFKIVITDIEKPTAIRRKVSYSEAIYSDEIEVEGIKGVFCRSVENLEIIIKNGDIPVLIDRNCEAAYSLKPIAVVDSILAKKNLGTKRDMAPITIGVGPGLYAKRDVDLVVETNRGHFLGKVIEEGEARKDTGIPGNIIGFTNERLIRALDDGVIKKFHEIGDLVKKGDPICITGEIEVRANIDGVIRGLLKNGLNVKEGMKIRDIDPRAIVEYTYTISDKARAIGGGVLEAIMSLRSDR